jgi:SAM-dependent methyltransferase
VTRREFFRLVEEHRPLPFERADETVPRRFHRPMNHALKNRERFWAAIRSAQARLPGGGATVLDLGAYPGTFLRLLHRIYGDRARRLTGAGLMVSSDFQRAMHEACGAEIVTVNLDPHNADLRDKGYPTRIPLDEGRVDFVFALEIVEHLVSPAHLFAEAFRVCAPGGHLLVTTPNVTRIGNVFKLLVGRSNFDRLMPVGYENPEDEWRPHFREYTIAEVGDFFERAGFEVVERRHVVAEDSRYNVRSAAQRLVDATKVPFYAVPHLRGDLVVVGRKPR